MPAATDLSLNQRYTLECGEVMLSGIQALVRLPMDLMRRDRARELNTGVFISGYRGSPLGGYDLQLARNQALLDQYNIRFQPGVNEELGATAVWGSQQVNLYDGASVDGVCGLWYGKSPGVDRSTDAIRHGNAAGSSPYGGVLVVVGDDHGCKSSSYPGQSEFAFVDMHMPILNPADVQEVLDYGLYGIELSRYSGCWVAMITLAENMDSAATVDIDPQRVQVETPHDFAMPEGGLNIRLPDSPLAQEERLWRYKRPAALAFCRKNKLNRIVLDNPDAKLGIVTAGKAHLDLLQAMEDLGINAEKAQQLGIRILKVGMTYPLDVEGIRDFARGLDYLFVVEEKRSLMEVQLKEELYNVEVVDPHFPKIVGKLDSRDQPLLPVYGELSPAVVAEVLVRALPNDFRDAQIDARLEEINSARTLAESSTVTALRQPFFCSGCPHNTSTVVPKGSRAQAGIGCHYLVQTMNRETSTFSQMGGEGVSWIGQASFTKTPHIFVNLGDGTYFHSGILAIRAAVAAKVNITYKILYNEAVAMTGGQPHDGELRPEAIASQVLAEGVKRLVWVMDDVKKYGSQLNVPKGAEVRHRDDLDAVQRQLRDTPGVTCILYDQTCATELRRKRKRGIARDPARRLVINDLVCEGCGDCSVQSNCISVEPKQTEFGVKRQINQTTCNKDFSCVKGFCPSFVSVEGGQLRKPQVAETDFTELARSLPAPVLPNLSTPWNLLITGIGGTGIVTVGALLATAAHVEGKAVTTLDQTGLAQKGGAVYTHVRFASRKALLHAVRISDASADAVIACDLVAAGAEAACLAKLNKGRTRVVANSNAAPTARFVLGKGDDVVDDIEALMVLIESRARAVDAVNAYDVTARAFGGTTTANIFMLGYAYQLGCVPLRVDSLFRAIELNGVAVSENIQTFSAGRLACVDPHSLEQASNTADEILQNEQSLEELIKRRVEHLTDYQNRRYAKDYQAVIDKVRQVEQGLEPTSETLTRTVACYAFKLMAYKDEYEVARLYTDGRFTRQVEAMFEGDYKLRFHLAPQLLSRPDRDTGVAKKREFGAWMLPIFRLLAWCKRLRGTKLDVFGFSIERKRERQLIEEYKATVSTLLESLCIENLDLACQIAALPSQIRGYGHVKERTIAEINSRWKTMLTQYQSGNMTHEIRKNHQVQYVDVTQLPG